MGNNWNPETINAVVADYEAGNKMRTITETHGITRAVAHRMIRNAGAAPTRVKQKSRDEHGDTDQTATELFQIIEQQDRKIRQLEELVEANGLVNYTGTV